MTMSLCCSPLGIPASLRPTQMYRKYADAIARARPGLLVCDEGHRLKNSSSNKTIASLRDCPARRRILLTGTPVQNDLEVRLLGTN